MYINTPAWLPRKLGRQTCVADRQRENWGKVRRDKKKGREKGARGKTRKSSHGEVEWETQRGETKVWTWTGRDFVKKSARFRTPGRKETRSWPCRTRPRIQSKRMSMLFDFLARTVSDASPTAHSLSHRIRGGGWGYPREPSARISSTAIWPLAKTPAYSDSETAAVTTGMRVEWTWMAALRKRGSEVPR